MALALHLVISGTVPPDARLFANGIAATVTGTAYRVEVPAGSGVISLRTVLANGAETFRTIQVVATAAAPA